MSESLWAARVDDLLNRTTAAERTPGGGSVAAITGALGVGLMQMAVAVTDGNAVIERHGSRLAPFQTRIVSAADADVRDFEAVMSAFRLPRGDDTQRDARLQAIDVASIAATDGPLFTRRGVRGSACALA